MPRRNKRMCEKLSYDAKILRVLQIGLPGGMDTTRCYASFTGILGVAGYQMQSFVSARDEGNFRNEARWLHQVQLSSYRWSMSWALCTSRWQILRDHDSRRRDGHLVSPDTEQSNGPVWRRRHIPSRCALMNSCELKRAVLFLHGRCQLTWLAPRKEE